MNLFIIKYNQKEVIKKVTGLTKTALILSAIGAINWGLTELGWNAVDALIGSWSGILASIVYYLVGICGIYALTVAIKE